MLTVVSIALLLVTKAKVDSLIPLYAIGVFTGFTMAGAGMAKYHLTHREDALAPAAWPSTASPAVLSFIVADHLRRGQVHRGRLGRRGRPARSASWSCSRLHRQYVDEDAAARSRARPRRARPRCCAATSVVVLVDRMDLATARAIQYARTLHARRAAGRALHHRPAEARPSSRREWSRLGLAAAAPRRHRVPRPPAGPGRPRARGRDSGRRRDRAAPSCCPAAASPPAGSACSTTARRPDRRRRRPAAPRERHHRALSS